MRWAGLVWDDFDLVTTAEKCSVCKPSSAYYRHIASAIDVQPSACLVVGNDVQLDLEGAAAIGMQTCLVDNEYQRATDGTFVPTFAVPLAGVAALVM